MPEAIHAMLTIEYRKTLPYPFDVVLSQYFDYEHIEHVHPETLGTYRVVETEGNRIVYEQTWPEHLWGNRRSLVEHLFEPPGEMWFNFLEGRHRGVRVHTRLSADGDATTIVDESYGIPYLPPWRLLDRFIRPFVVAPVERIWEEDISVDVCRDGWPGVPGVEPDNPSEPDGEDSGESFAIPERKAPAEGSLAGFEIDGRETVVARVSGRLCGFEGRCPHTGAPLALGRIEEGALVCPWHGARFDLQTGRHLSGPAVRPLRVVDVHLKRDD